MYLGIEIGGTKLQVGVGWGDGSPLVSIDRAEVEPARGAAGILEEIERMGRSLIERKTVKRAGIAFGGPVEPARGRVVKSHHIDGWDQFALVDWCRRTLGVAAVLANDADTAGLAEARFGAGRGSNPVFYITIGTGIGGGLVLDGKIYRGNGAGAAELGHLRPGLVAESPGQILEACAAGWGIAAHARRRAEAVLADGSPRSSETDTLFEITRQLRSAEKPHVDTRPDAEDLRDRSNGQLDELSARVVGDAAAAGNRLACDVLDFAWQSLGWAIAQMVTLLAPERIVIGGGVSLLGEDLLFQPLRAAVQRYVFPPLADTFEIVPAELGEETVVHGALALAADADESDDT